ncbi:MAG: hypothetical protein II705_08570 [Clostridia bacterium]|nr:hypothetical protein [Clostridia bacterium]MBQ4250080.1 hypothetical protein [Clostridia bacterium]
MESERKRLLFEAEQAIEDLSELLRLARDEEPGEPRAGMEEDRESLFLSLDVAMERLSEAADFIGEALWR